MSNMFTPKYQKVRIISHLDPPIEGFMEVIHDGNWGVLGADHGLLLSCVSEESARQFYADHPEAEALLNEMENLPNGVSYTTVESRLDEDAGNKVYTFNVRAVHEEEGYED